MDSIQKLLDIMVALRRDCPWDREQDFSSVAPYTVEEAYEVADAIAREDWPELRGELGDLLFQVVFHARMAEEQRLFDFDDVVAGICEKMTRRHPHVFGTAEEREAGAQPGSWEAIKADERGIGQEPDGSALAGIAANLPALKRAAKLGKRASASGFDWPDTDGVLDKIREEQQELQDACDQQDRDAMQHELGDLLFSIVNLARHLKLDPEQSLTEANRRFERRYRMLEARIQANGRSVAETDLESLEAEWQAAKQQLARNKS